MIAFSTIQHSQSAGATDHWNPNWLLAVIKQRLLYYDDVKWLDNPLLVAGACRAKPKVLGLQRLCKPASNSSPPCILHNIALATLSTSYRLK